jgi:hypothetical protein
MFGATSRGNPHTPPIMNTWKQFQEKLVGPPKLAMLNKIAWYIIQFNKNNFQATFDGLTFHLSNSGQR